MKILRAMEYIAAAIIIACVVLSLGKVAVDQIAYAIMPGSMAASPLPSEIEKEIYLASLRRSVERQEQADFAEMTERARGDK